jgi:hypothetical protein
LLHSQLHNHHHQLIQALIIIPTKNTTVELRIIGIEEEDEVVAETEVVVEGGVVAKTEAAAEMVNVTRTDEITVRNEEEEVNNKQKIALPEQENEVSKEDRSYDKASTTY